MDIRPEIQSQLNAIDDSEKEAIRRIQHDFTQSKINAFEGFDALTEEESRQLKILRFKLSRLA